MDFVVQLFTNKLLMAPVCSWLIAQILKTLVYLLINKRFRAERLFGGGGMPSSHSATVCALATITCLSYGPASFEFAIASVFAIVTMYDAMNVRLETGRQGEALNDLLAAFNRWTNEQVGPDKALKELIGHTPIQVLVGGLMGIGIAFAIYYI